MKILAPTTLAQGSAALLTALTIASMAMPSAQAADIELGIGALPGHAQNLQFQIKGIINPAVRDYMDTKVKFIATQTLQNHEMIVSHNGTQPTVTVGQNVTSWDLYSNTAVIQSIQPGNAVYLNFPATPGVR